MVPKQVMASGLKPLPLQFWRSNSRREPTRDWFKSLPKPDRQILGSDLRRVQFGWPIGMPLVRLLGAGLCELRSSLPSGREARVLFVVDRLGIVVLNGFIKKSQRTPPRELALAKDRLKEFDR
jgi:phage-related protein